MITFPNTLMAKLFKALYHPNNPIIEIAPSNHCSPYWKAILWGRDLIKQGIGWRVGNGSHISLRNDNWLPGSSNFKLYGTFYLPEHLIKVEDIINKHTLSWDEKLLDDFCRLIDKERILNTLLPLIPRMDKHVWMPAKDGNFSVKRAYWFSMHTKNLLKDNPSSSSNNSTRQFYWKYIWHTVVLPRLSHWVWQVTYDRLPIAQNLAKRNIIQNDQCCYCNLDTESLMHILYQCPFALELRTDQLMDAKYMDDFAAPQCNILTYGQNLLHEKGPAFFWTEIILCWKIWRPEIT